MSLPRLMFRVTFSVRRSESYFQFSVQSRIFNLAFKAAFSFWCSKSHLQFGIQSRCLVLVWNLEPSYHLHFGVQSCCLFLVRHSNSSCLLFVRRLESHLHLGIQSHIFSLVFRVVVCLQLDIQSHHIFRLPFRAVVHFSSAFKATPSVQYSKPYFPFGIQSRCSFLVWCLEPSFVFFQFDIQSHHVFLPFVVQSHVFILAFRVTSPVWHSELHLIVWRSKPHLQFSVHSHIFSLAFIAMYFFSLAFKAITCLSSTRYSEPYLQFNIWSHCFSFAFRAASSLWRSDSLFVLVWHLEPSHFFCSTFRAMSSIWHSKPLLIQAFDATIFLQFWRSELLCILIQAFRVTIISFLLAFKSFSSPCYLVTLCLLLVQHTLLDFPFHYT